MIRYVKSKQEGQAVASIAQNDPFPHARIHSECMRACVHERARNKFGPEFEPKLAIMRQCTSVTDRRTDRRTGIIA